MKIYDEWFEKNRNTIFRDFFTYLRFPSISTDPAHKKDILACKDWLANYMKDIGLHVEEWKTSGHPILFGESLKGGETAPTLLFYGHYDVQPTTPLEEWDTPPFEPEIRNNAIFARGALDNKGQGFYTLLAIRAFLEFAKEKKINIKVLVEGEEEIGSHGLQEIARKHSEKLKADHTFIVDLHMYAKGIPAVTLGVRGIVNVNVTLSNSDSDLHSGEFGGVALNPARALMATLGKMWDEKGRVTIPGFYDGVKTFSKEELAVFDWEKDIKKESAPLNVKVFQGEEGYSLLESNWIRPTLEINGMEGGYTGEGFKTIIPKQAMVKLSCRLVPDQDPKKVLGTIVTFLKKNLPEGIELNLEEGHGTRGLMTSPNSSTVRGVVKAYEAVYGVKCRRQLCGGTIPIAPLLSEVCGGELVLIGVGLLTDHIHAPNERIGLDRFKEGFLSISQILEVFSA